MSEVINLDALVSESQEIQLGGKTYQLTDPPVLDFLKFQQNIDACKNQLEQIGVAINFLYSLCPAAKEDKAFDTMNLKQVNTMVNILAGTIDEEQKFVGEVTPEDIKKK